MSSDGREYQVERLRRKFGMKKSEETLHVFCLHLINFYYIRELYPFARENKSTNKKMFRT